MKVVSESQIYVQQEQCIFSYNPTYQMNKDFFFDRLFHLM